MGSRAQALAGLALSGRLCLPSQPDARQSLAGSACPGRAWAREPLTAADRRQDGNFRPCRQRQRILGKLTVHGHGGAFQQPSKHGIGLGQTAAQVAHGGTGGKIDHEGIGLGQVPEMGKETYAISHRSTRSRMG